MGVLLSLIKEISLNIVVDIAVWVLEKLLTMVPDIVTKILFWLELVLRYLDKLFEFMC